MICYFCGKETRAYYWAPCPRVGVSAAVCLDCYRAAVKRGREAHKTKEVHA